MSLERHGSRTYFYYVRRVNGKLKKQYAGAGDVAIKAARELEEARLAARQRKMEVQTVDQLLVETCQALDLIVQAELEKAGYHRKKHEWRRKRHGKGMRSDP